MHKSYKGVLSFCNSNKEYFTVCHAPRHNVVLWESRGVSHLYSDDLHGTQLESRKIVANASVFLMVSAAFSCVRIRPKSAFITKHHHFEEKNGSGTFPPRKSYIALSDQPCNTFSYGMNKRTVVCIVKHIQASTPATQSKAMQANKTLTRPDCGLTGV